MPHDIVMPQLGMTMTEGTVLRWLKRPGETIEKGEPLFEVQTDKVDMEVESPVAGTVLEVLLEPQTVVPVGTAIARIAETGRPESEPEPGPSITPPAEHQRPGIVRPQALVPAGGASQIGASARQILASPRARKLAAELGVDLLYVQTGGARIVEADVRRHHSQYGSSGPSPVPEVRRELPTVTRRLIADRTTLSFQTAPHFYLTILADAGALAKLRDDLLPVVERRSGTRLSYTDLLVKALAIALRETPQVNVSWDQGQLIRHQQVHVGVAAQFGDKLLVPVIHNADRLPVPELARVRHELVSRGRAGRLTPADLEGATCTLSNLGAFGVDQFQAIINPPQSAILAVGRIAPRAVVADSVVTARQTVFLTLSVDHRTVDGAAGAAFLNSIVKGIEAPSTLLLET